MSFAFFPIVQWDDLRGGPSVVVTTSGETMMEDKLVVAVAGYPELYDFTRYHNNRKKTKLGSSTKNAMQCTSHFATCKTRIGALHSLFKAGMFRLAFCIEGTNTELRGICVSPLGWQRR